MQNIFEPYLLSFIPIFVAVDAIGNVPIFVSLIDGAKGPKRRKIIIDAVTTATAMAVIFMVAGKYILRLLGITISDFQIAGGAFLFIIAVRLLFPGAEKKVNSIGGDKDVGIFPLGTPLITGPAVLTTTVMMIDKYNIIPTFVSLVLNMLIVWISLDRSEAIMNVIGPSGTRAFSKIMYILLGAIGVMMIRHGIEAIFLH
ncbi:MAG: MarC family protein [Candidatus Omnitrophica bacterium]|jgi:multiple antibiotic resistance protein|nr:MarC family protein [Candidatus Omnitrophota bacterium]